VQYTETVDFAQNHQPLNDLGVCVSLFILSSLGFEISPTGSGEFLNLSRRLISNTDCSIMRNSVKRAAQYSVSDSKIDGRFHYRAMDERQRF
jgi:hypothetical protein